MQFLSTPLLCLTLILLGYILFKFRQSEKQMNTVQEKLDHCIQFIEEFDEEVFLTCKEMDEEYLPEILDYIEHYRQNQTTNEHKTEAIATKELQEEMQTIASSAAIRGESKRQPSEELESDSGDQNEDSQLREGELTEIFSNVTGCFENIVKVTAKNNKEGTKIILKTDAIPFLTDQTCTSTRIIEEIDEMSDD